MDNLIKPGMEIEVSYKGEIVKATVQKIGQRSAGYVMITVQLPDREIGYIAEHAFRVAGNGALERVHGS